MSLALSTSTMNFFSSSPVVSTPAPCSLSNDSPGLALPNDSPGLVLSSPSVVVDSSITLSTFPVSPDSHKACSTLTSSVTSISPAVPEEPLTSMDGISTASEVPVSACGSASIGCSPAVSFLSSLQSPPQPPLEMSSVKVAETSSVCAIVDPKANIAPCSSSPTMNPSTVLFSTSHSSPVMRSAAIPQASDTLKVQSDFTDLAETSPSMGISGAVSLPNVAKTHSSALSVCSGQTTGPLSQQERSSLRISTSLPSESTSSLSLLSSVDVASSSSLLPEATGPQMPTNPAASLEYRVSSSTSTASSSSFLDSTSCGTMPSTTLVPSVVSNSTASFTSLSQPTCKATEGHPHVEAMGCSPLAVRSESSNSASISNISPSLLAARSTVRVPNSGPPPVPSPEIFPRRPAKGGQKGEGWPYAPQGWPQHDDKWAWRVGKRHHVNGYFRDRVLGLPKSLCKGRKITEFASKKSIGKFLKQIFPDVSIENFFRSFQWRVPYIKYRNSFPPARVLKSNILKRQRPAEEDNDRHDTAKRSRKECGAGNPECGLQTGRSFLPERGVSLVCDVCCTEPGFCRECKCILCCKIIVPEVGDRNLIRCLQGPPGGGICGHAAHLECALQTKMAGVVKRRGLDMEYLCRRCDNKTDLRELVTLLLETLGHTELRTQAEKSLGLALEIMKGTEHGGSGARVLESLVQAALRKVQKGVGIRDVFSDLKSQGAAAEAAKQQNITCGASSLEDVSQQPEASLDQWLPSSGSPSSHPSPGTPSSFTSPVIKSNPSVNSGQLNGNQYVGRSSGVQNEATEDHTEHLGDPQTQPEIYSNANYMHSQLLHRSQMTNGGQTALMHRIHAVPSKGNNVREAICDSRTATTVGDPILESGARDGNSAQEANRNSNSGTKDHQKSPGGRSSHRDNALSPEICRSCGTVRRHASHVLEVTSSRKFPKIEVARKELLRSSLIPREREPGDSELYKHSGTGTGTGIARSGHPSVTSSDDASGLKGMGNSLHLLHKEWEADVQNALQKLGESQDAEFERAKERLRAQGESIMRQYELLEIAQSEFSELPDTSSLQAFDEAMQRTAEQYAKARDEREKFSKMLKVAEGFGSVSREVLERFYGWPLGTDS